MAVLGKHTVQYRLSMTFKNKTLGNVCIMFFCFTFFLCMSTAGYQHCRIPVVAAKYGVLNKMT